MCYYMFLFILVDSILHNSQTWSAKRNESNPDWCEYTHARIGSWRKMHKQQYFFMWYLVSNEVKWSMCSHLANVTWLMRVKAIEQKNAELFFVKSFFSSLVRVDFIWIDCRLALQSALESLFKSNAWVAYTSAQKWVEALNIADICERSWGRVCLKCF